MQQSHILISSRLGACGDGGLEEGFRKMVGCDLGQRLFSHLFETLSIFCKYSLFIGGWVCTNDTWLGPRPAPYTSSRGRSVTRCRR